MLIVYLADELVLHEKVAGKLLFELGQPIALGLKPLVFFDETHDDLIIEPLFAFDEELNDFLLRLQPESQLFHLEHNARVFLDEMGVFDFIGDIYASFLNLASHIKCKLAMSRWAFYHFILVTESWMASAT